MQKLKLLFILPEYLPHAGGGISTYYQHYISSLQPYCERIKVIVGSGYVQKSLKFAHESIEIEYLEPGLYADYSDKFTRFNLIPEYKNNIAAAWAMWHQAGFGDGFDIVECTDFGMGFIPWITNHNKPVITRLHGSSGQIALHEEVIKNSIADDLTRQTELLLLPLCDGLITYSLANQLFWSKLISKPVTYIPPVFSGVEKDAVPFSEKDKSGLVTARVQKWKGPAEVCKTILSTETNTSIDWIGRDTAYDDKQTTTEFLTAAYPEIWGKRIVHHSAKPQADIKYLQAKAKFGLVPSTWDMFNFTCVEFMTSGTLVICSDGAGAADLIKHGINGFKYPANDTEAMARCIDVVSALDENDYQKITVAAVSTVDNELSPQKIVATNIECYDDFLREFEPSKANIYIEANYKPLTVDYPLSILLDKQPIKKLAKYIFQRTVDKIKKQL